MVAADVLIELNSSFAATSDTGISCMPSFFPRSVHEQVAEVAGAFGGLQGGAQRGYVGFVLGGVGHVHDEPGVAAVVAVLAAEQCGGLVEQGALQRGEPFGEAVDFLVNVGLAQAADGAGKKRVFILPVAHLVVAAEFGTAADVLGQDRLQAQRLAEHVALLFQVGVAQPEPVQGELFEGLARQQAVGDEGAGEHVAFEVEARLQEYAGPGGFSQAGGPWASTLGSRGSRGHRAPVWVRRR